MGAAIPGSLKLRLFTEDLHLFPNDEDIAKTAVEQVYVEVALLPGENITWQIKPLFVNYD